MNGRQFVRRARRYAGERKLEVCFVPGHGKGSHGRLYVGDRFTTVKEGEIGKDLYHLMLRQLGIRKEEF